MSRPPSPNDWQELEPLVDVVLDAPPERRAALIEELSGGDDARRTKLRRMVAACEQSYPFLDGPAAERFAAMFADEPAPIPALLAERYRVSRELGRGGMAVVYLARDLRHERDVAVKVLRPDLTSGVGPDRFQREIRLAAQLTHPHILPLLDSGDASVEGESPTRLWYTMPFISGESLRDRLTRERQLPVAEALRIAAEVADALDYAHRQGFIHRDIKPENILLQDGHALVADFGIARAIDSASENRLTATGILVGTPTYMSPEQATGGQVLDGRTDVYALGCVLYEMLTGIPPFTGPTPMAIVAQVMTGEPTRVSVMRPSAAGFEAVLAHALARLPADRFATAREFATALATAQSVERATGGVARLRLRRYRVMLTVGTVAIATVALAWIMWTSAKGRSSTFAAGDTPVVAVRPIESLSDLPGDRAFAAAMHDQIIGELSTINSIVVLDRAGMLAYRGDTIPLPKIASELGATHIVDATVVTTGGRVRISARLYDRAGRYVWGDPFERELTDILGLQAEVARAIAKRIEAVLTPAEARRLAAASPSVDTAAFRLYAEGRNNFEAGGPLRVVPNDSASRLLQRADELLERSTQIDSSFSLAWAYLARSRHWLASISLQSQADSLYVQARHAAERAIQIDPNEALGWAALGFVEFRTWKFRDAEIAYDKARRLSQNAAAWDLGYFYRALGRLDEAVDAYERARARDPGSILLRAQLGYVLACANRFDEALPLLDPAVVGVLGPGPRTERARALVRQRRYSEAVQEFEAQTKAGEPPPALMAYAYARTGNAEKAKQTVSARERAGTRNLGDDLAVDDRQALINRLLALAANRDQYLLGLRCFEFYPDLLEIPEARAIIDRLGPTQ
jgi:serine/threonine-protein kinase